MQKVAHLYRLQSASVSMTNVYFTWFGGEGGDFLMNLLHLCLTGKQNFYITEDGQCMDGISEFTVNNCKFIKQHMIFTNKNFQKTKDKFVFYIKNPDRSLHLKKKIGKLNDFPMTFPPPPKPLVRKVFKALENKDFQTVYYYLFCNFETIYNRYAVATEKMLSTVPHHVIENNLISHEDIIAQIKTVTDKLKISITMDDKILSLIEYYVEKQKQYTNLDWPHLEY